MLPSSIGRTAVGHASSLPEILAGMSGDRLSALPRQFIAPKARHLILEEFGAHGGDMPEEWWMVSKGIHCASMPPPPVFWTSRKRHAHERDGERCAFMSIHRGTTALRPGELTPGFCCAPSISYCRASRISKTTVQAFRMIWFRD